MRNGMGSWAAGGAVHLLGVCGVGVAGLARLLAARGWRASGCDAARSEGMAAWLEAAGIPVAEGHDPSHLAGVGCVVASSAVDEDEPELAAARAAGLPVFRRGEVLASILSEARGVAVCGAHGKTTTACFTVRLLQELGASPGWCIGGSTRRLGGVAGGQSEESSLLVAEADESDGTLALYRPAVTVLTNIDLDHLEHFGGEAELVDCFRRAVLQTREGVAVCRDNDRAWGVVRDADVPVLDFGFSKEASLRADRVSVAPGTVSFDLMYRGGLLGRVRLGVSGRHNVLNALGAMAAALLLGFKPEAVFRAVACACAELPGRRFETVVEVPGYRFVADYAHHPAELRAAVEMACAQQPGRLIVVFQPHRYTRTLALGADFPAAFSSADEVILLPVYAASEDWIDGGSVADLYAHFRVAGAGARESGEPRSGKTTRVKLARSREEVWGYLRQVLVPGDLVLLAGAGDVIELAGLVRADVARGWPAIRGAEAFGRALAEVKNIRSVEFGALADWTFFGVGGRARWRVEVPGETELAEVLSLCAEHGVRWQMTGMGANRWFSDLGEPGCVIRFAPGACQAFQVEGAFVEAGCGWSGPVLLDRLEREGLSGLEFLEGVPGSLGGWLAMNAGAHGSEIASKVAWIRCLNPDGKTAIVKADDCCFAYRQCSGLVGRVAVACGLRLSQAERRVIKRQRKAVREARIPLAGLRTEGSVFRNPAGDSAGRLLEQAGCKGLRIGGAWVIDFHANIVAVDGDATASDVLALVSKMRGRVEHNPGVTLVPEIRGLEDEQTGVTI